MHSISLQQKYRNTTIIPIQSSNATAETDQIISNSTPHRLIQLEMGKYAYAAAKLRRTPKTHECQASDCTSPRKLHNSIEPRRRRDTGPRQATELQDQRRNRRGEGGNSKPALERGRVAGRPAQVRKPWISEATSGSRPPAPPAMVALLLLPHTLSLSTACVVSSSLSRGEEEWKTTTKAREEGD